VKKSSSEGADRPDIIELDAIHASRNGVCYDAKGDASDIAHFRKAVVAENFHVEDGGCKDATNCREWRDMTLCRSDATEDLAKKVWGTSDTVHAVKNGKCLQLQGKMIKDKQVDTAIAAKLASNKATLEEGPCPKSKFGKKVYHNENNGVRISVWD